MVEIWIALALFGGLVLAGAALRLWGQLVRRRAMGLLPDDATVHRGVSMRVMARGRHGLPGIASGRTHRTTADVGYTDDRLVIGSNRGVLVDVRVDGGRFLTSVRTTGPGKLVIEGETPGASGPVGSFRFELGIARPEPWVDGLRRFVRVPEGRLGFGSAPATDAAPEPP
ncbi:MAG: hypothetical protein AAF602_25150 [Myxococcota bacterium]